MSMSDYLEGKILDHIFGITAFTAPTPNVWLALFTTSPTDANSGTECTGGAYARVQITNGGAAWTRATSTIDNDAVITFPTASGANWGTVSHFGLYDAATVGNLLWWGAVTTPLAVDDGNTASFPAGDLDFILD